MEDELFHFVAAGNNRDGLALRAASHLMELSPKPKKLLFMFSDASPQDDQIAGEGAFYKDREYTDALAVKDTVNEVQRLKNHGIDVIGIFMGSEHDSELATKIFGRSLVKTVDESRAWLKRIVITWAILNGLGFIMAYITPFFAGGKWNG